jgi:hypothetical protein
MGRLGLTSNARIAKNAETAAVFFFSSLLLRFETGVGNACF